MKSVQNIIQVSKISLKQIGYLFLLVQQSQFIFAYQQQPKPSYYRYYDQRGIENISTQVTPNHIRHGYDALDRNMQVIERKKAYNVEKDLKQSAQRKNDSEQQQNDLRLKRAYTSSSVAINKRNSTLVEINKQIQFQTEQLNTFLNDRVKFKQKADEYKRTGKPVPESLQNNLNFNASQIEKMKTNINQLKKRHNDTQKEYDYIVERLQKMER